jgi:UDP-glucose:glycoprotein glucosyltransferase
MADPQTLSSYQLALSLRSAAPRIEAHYQYYHTAVEPSIKVEEDTPCPTWVLLNGIQYCSPSLDEPHGEVKGNMLSPLNIGNCVYASLTSSADLRRICLSIGC